MDKMASMPMDGKTLRWWETRLAEFLLTLGVLILLGGAIAVFLKFVSDQMHRPPGPEEEARFYKEVAPHWQPSDIKANSVVIDRDEGAMYGELKASEPFKGIRMTPLDKEARIWRYDVGGRSYAVLVRQPRNSQWVLRTIHSRKVSK